MEGQDGVKVRDLVGKPPSKNTLGVHWNRETNTFEFRMNLKQKPLTRRGALSLLSSVCDPFGFAAPFLTPGKLLIQQHFKLEQCFKPVNFETVVDSTLHDFSDASKYGYGQVSYLQLVDSMGIIHCSLVIGKARIAS